MANEFRVEKSQSGYRIALYRDGKYDVTFLDGLTLGAAKREAQSLTLLWERIGRASSLAEGAGLKRAS
ncbi:MAG TPA: hypothetical protein VLC12_12420 [Terriglobales bacterium]|nr:hypothetical protein [Terriglobales bacterium]